MSFFESTNNLYRPLVKKQQFMRAIYVFAVLFLVINIGFSQSAWVKSKGEWYTQLAYNDISNYDRIFNKNGDDLYTAREVSDRTIQWYNEYGLTNKLTLVASIPYKVMSTGDVVAQSTFPVSIEKGNLAALGNIAIAARYLLLNKKVNLTTQFQIGLPTGQYDSATGLRSGIDAWVFNPSIAIGKGGHRWFAQSNLGLHLRTNDYSNGLKFYVEGGYKFFDKLWVIAFIDIVDAFEDGAFVEPIENRATFSNLNNSEYGGFGMKFIRAFSKKFGLTAAFGGAFSAHQEAHRASLNFGAYYKLKK